MFLLGCGPSRAAQTPTDSSGWQSIGDEAGVATDASDVGVRRICDGSDGIRFAIQVQVASGRVNAFTAVLYELGYGFVYIDGHCHYWMQQPSLPTDDFLTWRSYREGVLTSQQEMTLHDAVAYDDFTKAPHCADTTVSDGSPVLLWDGERIHACNGNPQVDADWPMRAELFEQGVPLDGPVRVVVGETPVPDDATLYSWPLSTSPLSYEVSYSEGQEYGKSALVSNPDDVALLRKLKATALSDAQVAPGKFYGIISIQPKGDVFAMRDDLPFTNPSSGLWSP